MLSDLVEAAIVTGGFAALAYVLGMVSRDGALGGFIVGAAIYTCLGLQGFAILTLFVVCGSVLTRLGYRSKQGRGIAESRGGRRGARNALANCGVAVTCAFLATLTSSEVFAASFVASLGAAFADTAESEVGQLARRAPRVITTLRKAPPGTDGAVSVPGTLAGIAAAVLIAFLGFAVGLLAEPGAALVVASAAFLGTVADSLVGALAPRIGNESTNLLCTFVAATLAFLLG